MSLDFLQGTDVFLRLLTALRKQKEGVDVSGLIAAAKPYFLSLLAQEESETLIFIRPSTASLSSFEEACRFFLEQLGNSARISVLPSFSDSPYQKIPPSLETVSARMRFLYTLRRKPPSLLITNLLGLLKLIPSKDDLGQLFVQLEPGDSFGRDQLIQTLNDYGYAKEDLVNSHGEFAWRGGIVDVYSPWETHPFRVEFSGDEVVSLRLFQPSNQRSFRKEKKTVIPSLGEFPESSTMVAFDHYYQNPLFIIDDKQRILVIMIKCNHS